jgi:hypothetical protein
MFALADFVGHCPRHSLLPILLSEGRQVAFAQPGDIGHLTAAYDDRNNRLLRHARLLVRRPVREQPSVRRSKWATKTAAMFSGKKISWN